MPTRLLLLCLAILTLVGCQRGVPAIRTDEISAISTDTPTVTPSVTAIRPRATLLATVTAPRERARLDAAPAVSVTIPPTPSPTPAATATAVPDLYTVQRGDTVERIAEWYGLTPEDLRTLNQMAEGAALRVGQTIAVPSSITAALPPLFLTHDSEVVYGTSYLTWNTGRFVEEQAGYLARYREGGRSGAEIIDVVAAKYHIGPRVLLAAMEMASGWVTREEPNSLYAFGLKDGGRAGLTAQASWAAKKLAEGYYGQLDGRRDWVVLSNGVAARLHPGTKPGSAAVANLLASTIESSLIIETIRNERFPDIYRDLFGAVDGGHIRPPAGQQPYFDLPWTRGERWYFTGGPHGGYGDVESGWAALDFAPPVGSGCRVSSYRVRAIAPGLVLASDRGETWIDMDEDGDIRTGWVILYMHLASRGRITEGAVVKLGDVLGYPSCEGGFASGAHVHVARMYHGQWMPAGGEIPFQLGEWQAQRVIGHSYAGLMIHENGQELEACDCRDVVANQFPPVPQLRGGQPPR